MNRGAFFFVLVAVAHASVVVSSILEDDKRVSLVVKAASEPTVIAGTAPSSPLGVAHAHARSLAPSQVTPPPTGPLCTNPYFPFQRGSQCFESYCQGYYGVGAALSTCYCMTDNDCYGSWGVSIDGKKLNPVCNRPLSGTDSPIQTGNVGVCDIVRPPTKPPTGQPPFAGQSEANVDAGCASFVPCLFPNSSLCVSSLCPATPSRCFASLARTNVSCPCTTSADCVGSFSMSLPTPYCTQADGFSKYPDRGSFCSNIIASTSNSPTPSPPPVCGCRRGAPTFCSNSRCIDNPNGVCFTSSVAYLPSILLSPGADISSPDCSCSLNSDKSACTNTCRSILTCNNGAAPGTLPLNTPTTTIIQKSLVPDPIMGISRLDVTVGYCTTYTIVCNLAANGLSWGPDSAGNVVCPIGVAIGTAVTFQGAIQTDSAATFSSLYLPKLIGNTLICSSAKCNTISACSESSSSTSSSEDSTAVLIFAIAIPTALVFFGGLVFRIVRGRLRARIPVGVRDYVSKNAAPSHTLSPEIVVNPLSIN